MEGHEFIVNQVLFSKDGKKLISVSKDKTMRLWDVKSGKLLLILHGDSTPLVSAALSPDGKLIALSNLKKEILLFKFPNNTNELDKNFEENYLKNEGNTNVKDEISSNSVGESVIIDLNDLKEIDNDPKSDEKRSVYSVNISSKFSIDQSSKQNHLNKLLKKNITCDDALELEKVSLEILKVIPNDLAAFHSLVKVSIVKRDFNILRLLLMAGEFAQLDNNRYDYISLEEVRIFFEKLRIEFFDQSFFRRGNIKESKLVDCRGMEVLFIVSEMSKRFYYPKEFIEKITKIPRMIDLRDFMGLDTKEFQNRMFAEIDRVIENVKPHHPSRVSRTSREISDAIPFGRLNINFEKVQTFKENGMVSFLLRKQGGKWQTYYSDMDNQIIMNLQAGRYYLKILGILRKTFTLISGSELGLNLD